MKIVSLLRYPALGMRRGLTILFITFCFTAQGYSQTLPYTPPGDAIASSHPLATNAGLEILAQGGNAFDAAIAVAATLAVVEPYHSGLGGGGFWLLYHDKTHTNIFVDAREVAPQAASKHMFLDSDGKVIPGLSLNGGLAQAIPGQVAAFTYIAKKYGRLPLSQTLAPAIKLASEGFPVDMQLIHFLTMGDRLEQLKKYPGSAAIFLKDGRAYRLGEKLVQRDLAKTLRLIAKRGNDGFYKGEIAEKLVRGNKAAGGIWTIDDLARYKIKIREPLIGAYHNMLVITAPLPSAGGVALLTMLNILSNFELDSMSTLQWTHYVIESMRLAYWQVTQFLGDPDFVQVPVAKLVAAENAKQLATLITKDKAIDSQILQGTQAKDVHANTSHISVIDDEGNRVSATMTINFIFGSSVVAPGTGVLLNDEMDDFSSKTGQKNVFGLVGSDNNAIAPGKRPLSFMTPSFLELPGRLAVVGTPGGTRIPTMVLLAALVFHDSYGAISMVSAMRFHHQFLPDVVQFEPDSLSLVVQEGLKAMGYHLMPLNQYYGDMQAITWDKVKNQLTATSDPRHIGLAAVVGKNKGGYGVNY